MFLTSKRSYLHWSKEAFLFADYASYDNAASKMDCRKRQKGDLSNHECVATQAKPVIFACSSSILQLRDWQYIPEDKVS